MLVCIVFVIVLVGAFFVVDPIYHYLTTNAISGAKIELNAFSFWDGVGVYMKIAMLVSLGITLPFTLYQVWAFVSPGLRPAERRATVKYIPFVFICFLVGLAFGYYVVFPLAMSFTGSLNKQLGLVETYGMADYFKFMMNLVLPISLLFEPAAYHFVFDAAENRNAEAAAENAPGRLFRAGRYFGDDHSRRFILRLYGADSARYFV